ncbi:uncharacterized protein [Arachis hypogaea]|uniref:uncharacterized protein n=1 Tax=Arachis hypogaea TaxID=3818 RepID=UPI003B22683C
MKQVKLSVKEAMKLPNGRKIALRFNETLQLVGAEAGILSGILGLLGFDYTKFLICGKRLEKDFLQDKIYNVQCVKEKCRKNTKNRSKQLYTHTGGSKSLARLGEEKLERQGRKVSRGELWTLTHKRPNSSYIYDATRVISVSNVLRIAKLFLKRITDIEQHDEFSRLLSQNYLLAQTLGKEHSGRVRGIGLGPTSSQVFGMNFHQPSNGAQR